MHRREQIHSSMARRAGRHAFIRDRALYGNQIVWMVYYEEGILMKTFSFCFLAGMAVYTAALASENPFQEITERNVFGLRPVPVRIRESPLPPPEPRAEIKLTGIATLLGDPEVFLQVVDPKTKKRQSLPGLKTGERFGDIVILAVDADDGIVRVRDGGEEQTLDFERNGIKRSELPAVVPIRPLPAVTWRPAVPGNVIYAGAGQPSRPPLPVPQINREEIMARIEAQRRLLLEKQRANQ
jgi:hypothetical protein